LTCPSNNRPSGKLPEPIERRTSLRDKPLGQPLRTSRAGRRSGGQSRVAQPRPRLDRRHPHHSRRRVRACSATSRAARCKRRRRIDARSSEREMISADAGTAPIAVTSHHRRGAAPYPTRAAALPPRCSARCWLGRRVRSRLRRDHPQCQPSRIGPSPRPCSQTTSDARTRRESNRSQRYS
jgi:hypothetical protein